MVHHIVIWRLKKNISEEERAACLNGLLLEIETLKTIPGVIDFDVTTRIHSRSTLEADVLLRSAHATQADLDMYYDHPVHTGFVGRIAPFVDSRDRLDYEV